MRWLHVSVVVLGILSAGAERGASLTIRVPEDSPSVLEAVDRAMPGDSVLVGAGTWTDRETRTIVAENGPTVYTACAYPRGGVIIRGQGQGVTILDVGDRTGWYMADIVFVERRGQGPLRVESLTLRGARAYGSAVGGLYADGIECRSCAFEANDGAMSLGECPGTMVDCVMIGNAQEGGVVWVVDCALQMTHCRFERNSGICIQTYTEVLPHPITIRDCEFIRNRGPGFGVCADLAYASGFVIEGNLFLENVAELAQSGAGVRVVAGSGEIRHNVFAYDSVYAASSIGAGVILEATDTVTTGNTFVGCHTNTTLGGAAYAAGFGSVGEFTRNVVSYITGGAAVRFGAGTSIVGGCNLFWANPSGNFGGGGSSDPTDVIADPLFCDLENLDFTVRDDSPCLNPPTPSCVPIGALGAGCGAVSVEPMSFARIKTMFR